MEDAPVLQYPSRSDDTFETVSAGYAHFVSVLVEFDVFMADLHIVCVDLLRDCSSMFQKHLSDAQISVANDLCAAESVRDQRESARWLYEIHHAVQGPEEEVIDCGRR